MNKKLLFFVAIGGIILLSSFTRKKSKMSEAEKIIKTAKLYEGIKEVGNNQGFTNAAFQNMMSSVGWKSGDQWCAFFCKAVYNNALPELASDFNKSLGGSTQRTFNNVKAGKSQHLKVVTSGTPAIGDIVIWVNKSDSSKGHAGIVIELNGGNSFTCIEGNVNYKPATSGENELVDIVPHKTSIGSTDSVYRTKNLRGFIRLK